MATRVSVVTNVSGTTDAATSTTVEAAAQNLVTGNANVVAVRYDGSATTVSVSDTAGNTYTQIQTVVGSSAHNLHLFSCENATANASNIVTATLTATRTYRRIFVVQYNGTAAASIVDDSDTASGVSATPETPDMSASTAGTVIGFAGIYDDRTVTAGSGFSIVAGGAAGDYCAIEERFVSAGTYKAGVTFGAPTGSWTLIGAIIKDSASLPISALTLYQSPRPLIGL